MNAAEIIQEEQQYVLQTYVRPEIVFTHGEGPYLYDSAGKRYLDFGSGIAVTALGHADPAVTAAVADQAGKLTHVSNLYHTAPHAGLARRLVEHSFADRVYFCNSGAEANEAALKFARKYAREKREGQTGVIAFSGGFHGRTMGALAMTYKSQYREPFAPLVPGVDFLPFNDVAALEQIGPETCAVIVEPVQGEGGVRPADAAFLQAVRERCDATGALLIFDEVQCGLGRTGRLWAHQAYGITPDLMTLAKPLANGLPIGATLLTQPVADVIQPGDHGSTFAAGPLVCRAASVVFDRVHRPEFLEHVRAVAGYLQESLHEVLPDDVVVELRGAGLLVGVEMNVPVKPLLPAAAAEGLIVINAGENVLRLAPPLIIEREHVDEAVAIIEKVVHQVTA
jgi:predicted acetylornithine/succinylornithine family transaminase